MLIQVLFAIIIYVFVMSYIDHKKVRKHHSSPNISFIIPCYNDWDTIENTIKSIYHCYDKNKSQVIVINDASKDDSPEKIKKLNEKYNFLFIDQKHNTGKTIALNNASKQAIHDIIVFIDADTLLNQNALDDMLKRLEHEKNVVATTCPYKPMNKGFLPTMQAIEYNLSRFTNGSYNYRSSVMTMRWWCIAIYKKQFIEAGMFSLNAISEDMDLWLKLKELWYRAQQSLYTVETWVPYTLKSRYKQKLRWSSGWMQCLIQHFRVWITNPIFVIFTVLFQVSLILRSYYFVKNTILFGNFIDFCITLFQLTTFQNWMNILQWIYWDNAVAKTLQWLSYSIVSIPYVIPLINKYKKIRKIILVIPYNIIYIPMHSTLWLVWSLYGVYQYKVLKNKDRAW